MVLEAATASSLIMISCLFSIIWGAINFKLVSSHLDVFLLPFSLKKKVF